MDLFSEFEQSLESELSRCQSQYELYQEMDWIVKSNMTRLQEREEKIISDLERLREAHDLFSQTPTAYQPDETDYTLYLENTQETVVGISWHRNYRKTRKASSSQNDASFPIQGRR